MSQFWRPVLSDRNNGNDESIALNNRYKHLSIEQQRDRLPIASYRDHILFALESFTTIILVSETGSGKSTQIARYLYDAGWADGARWVYV